MVAALDHYSGLLAPASIKPPVALRVGPEGLILKMG